MSWRRGAQLASTTRNSPLFHLRVTQLLSNKALFFPFSHFSIEIYSRSSFFRALIDCQVKRAMASRNVGGSQGFGRQSIMMTSGSAMKSRQLVSEAHLPSFLPLFQLCFPFLVSRLASSIRPRRNALIGGLDTSSLPTGAIISQPSRHRELVKNDERAS